MGKKKEKTTEAKEQVYRQNKPVVLKLRVVNRNRGLTPSAPSGVIPIIAHKQDESKNKIQNHSSSI